MKLNSALCSFLSLWIMVGVSWSSQENREDVFNALTQWPRFFLLQPCFYMNEASPIDLSDFETVYRACTQPQSAFSMACSTASDDNEKEWRLKQLAWVYACYRFSGLLQKKNLVITADLLTKINAAVTKGCEHENVDFRTEELFMAFPVLSVQEKMLLYLLRHRRNSLMVNCFYDAETQQVDINNLYWSFQNQEMLNMLDPHDLTDEHGVPFTFNAENADMTELRRWAREQGGLNVFLFPLWQAARMIAYPKLRALYSRLDQYLQPINNSKCPLEKATRLFFFFTGHNPFADGNMRTARLIVSTVLARAGHSLAHVDHTTYRQYRVILVSSLLKERLTDELKRKMLKMLVRHIETPK